MKLIGISICFLAMQAFAGLSLPEQMTSIDRRQTLEALGPGTSARILSAPYPLGGYEGFEVGISRHFINTDIFQNLGSGVSSQKEFSYPILSLGKGLFYDVDIYVNLVPFAQSETITHFSALARWNFFRFENWPALISLVPQMGTTTLNNSISIENSGYDLIGSLFVDNLSLFFGFGNLTSVGQFIGGPSGTTDSGNTEVEKIASGHSLVGIDLRLKRYFLAGQIDRYTTNFYSLKLGYRF